VFLERKFQSSEKSDSSKKHRAYPPLPLLRVDLLDYREELISFLPKIWEPLPFSANGWLDEVALSNELAKAQLMPPESDPDKVREKQKVFDEYLVKRSDPYYGSTQYRLRDIDQVQHAPFPIKLQTDDLGAGKARERVAE